MSEIWVSAMGSGRETSPGGRGYSCPLDRQPNPVRTGSIKLPLIMAGYLFGLAYLASFITYRVALMLGAG